MERRGAFKGHLQDLIQGPIATDFSKTEFSLGPIRESVLPYVSPLGSLLWLNYGEQKHEYFLASRLIPGINALIIFGTHPNTKELKEFFGPVESNHVSFGQNYPEIPDRRQAGVYQIGFHLHDNTVRELQGNKRLITATGLELLNFNLHNGKISEEEKRIGLSQSQHSILWHTPNEIHAEYEDPERIQISFYPEKIIVSSKDSATAIFEGKNWLVGKKIEPSEEIYLAQEGSKEWWEVSTEPHSFELESINDDERDRTKTTGIFAEKYQYRNNQYPVWIANQMKSSVEGRLHYEPRRLPIVEWQNAHDFEITIGSMIHIVDNSDPKHMPFYEAYKAFDPLVTAPFFYKDPEKRGHIVGQLASLDNLLHVMNLRPGVRGEMREITENVVNKLNALVKKFGGEPELMNPLVQELHNIHLL